MIPSYTYEKPPARNTVPAELRKGDRYRAMTGKEKAACGNIDLNDPVAVKAATGLTIYSDSHGTRVRNW